MKPLSIASVFVGFCLGPITFAQQAVAPQAGTVVVETAAAPLPDLFYMASGSVVSRRGTDSTQLQAPVRLADGSTLTPGGTVTRPDGTRNQLIDGQMITSGGKIGSAPGTTGQESNAVDKTPERKAGQ